MPRTRHLRVLVVSFSLLAALALVAPPPAAADDTVNVSGVVSTHAGQVIIGAVMVEDADGNNVGYGNIDENGRFSVDVVPGTYDFTFGGGFDEEEYLFHGSQISFVMHDVVVDRDLTLAASAPERPLVVHLAGADSAPRSGTALLDCLEQVRARDGEHVESRVLHSETTGSGDLTVWGFVLSPDNFGSFTGCRLTVKPDRGNYQSFAVTMHPGVDDEIDVVIPDAVTVSGEIAPPASFDFDHASLRVTDDAGDVARLVELDRNEPAYSIGLTPGHYTFDFEVEGEENRESDIQPDQLSQKISVQVSDEMIVSPDLGLVSVTVHPVDGNGDPAYVRATVSCFLNTADGEDNIGAYRQGLEGDQDIALSGVPDAPGVFCELEALDQNFNGSSGTIRVPPGGGEFTVVLGAGVYEGTPGSSGDDDGVPNLVEAQAPNGGDGNLDGTPDYDQVNVTSLPAKGGSPGPEAPYVTVAGPTGTKLADVFTLDPDTLASQPPPGTTLPAGLASFRLTDVPSGTDQTVSIWAGSTDGVNGYAKYDADTGTWSMLSSNRVHVFDDHVEVTLTDGGEGDADGVANGTIVDPGGIAKTASGDTTPPVVTGRATTRPNGNGWYAGNVRVDWTASDPSGVKRQPEDTIVTAQGGNVSASSPLVCDKAPTPNCGRGTVSGLRIDKTAPNVSVAGIHNGATYTLGAVPTPSCTASDALSGLSRACKGTKAGGNSNGVGSFAYVASAADKAGNIRVVSASYRVVYRFDGFLQPVNDPALSPGSALSVFKAGSTVPVAVTVKRDNGQVVTPVSRPIWVSPVKGARVSAPVNEAVSHAPGSTGTTFSWSSNKWLFNWSTKKVAAGYAYRLGVRLDDGTTHYVTIGVR